MSNNMNAKGPCLAHCYNKNIAYIMPYTIIYCVDI